MFEVKNSPKVVKKRGGGVIRGVESLRMGLEGLLKGFGGFEGY